MSAPSSDKAAIRQTIRALVEAGWHPLEVYDGEEVVPATTESEAIDAIMAVDDATLVVTEGLTAPIQKGWIRFVMGNEPFEVICDHTINLSGVIDPLTNTWED